MSGKKSREARKAAEKRGSGLEDEKEERRDVYARWRKEKASQNKATGYNGSRKFDRNIENRKNGNETAEEELEERANYAAEMLKIDLVYLSDILSDFGNLDDPRDQRRITYSMKELMGFGLLSFRFHAESRRESNAKISPVLWDNLRDFFPLVNGVPHSDTLGNLLERLPTDQFEQVKQKLIDRLIRSKRLDAFYLDGRIPMCIDGVHKFTREYEWCANALESKISGKAEDEKRYYASALEASIILPNGHTLPVMTEFMDRAEHGDVGTDTEKRKQDCETNAAKRLIARLREWHPKLKLSLSMDGLYATGPMLELCRAEKIDVMAVLKGKSIPTVWEEVKLQIDSGISQSKPAYECNGVRQEFFWVNDIEYIYGMNQTLKLNVAVCVEHRTGFVKESGAERTSKSTFAWVSLRHFTERNIESRCNCLGRPRWNLEAQNRIEKYDGYSYSHCYSYNWNAMLNYHTLMQLAYMLNIIAFLSTGLASLVKSIGFKGAVKKLLGILDGMRWNAVAMRARIPKRYQIRWAV